jgi:multiple sugar transport system permease protein
VSTMASAAASGGRPKGAVRRSRAAMVAYWVVGGAIAVLFVFPMIWSLIRSLQTSKAFLSAPTWGSMVQLTFRNYSNLLNVGSGILQYALNSLLVGIATAIVTVILATMAGYGFARFSFPFKRLGFVLILAVFLVPFQSLLAPLMYVLKTIHLDNSLAGLAVVYITFQLPLSVFIMRNSFAQVPRALEEAAILDGASTFAILRRVMWKLVFPGTVTVALFTFLFAWNEFLASLTFITTNTRYTLPVALVNVELGTFGQVNYGVLEAGAVIAMVPCLVLFLLLQRYYVRGLLAGATKG